MTPQHRAPSRVSNQWNVTHFMLPVFFHFDKMIVSWVVILILICEQKLESFCCIYKGYPFFFSFLISSHWCFTCDTFCSKNVFFLLLLLGHDSMCLYFLALDSNSSHLLPVYTAEKRVSLDICEARLNLASQPFLRILLGPRQSVINGTQKRSNKIWQRCETNPCHLTSTTSMLIIFMVLLYVDLNGVQGGCKIHFCPFRCYIGLNRITHLLRGQLADTTCFTAHSMCVRCPLLAATVGQGSFHDNIYDDVVQRRRPHVN